MNLAHNIFASIRNEQERIEELRYAVQAKANLLKYKRLQVAELETQNSSLEESFYSLRSSYGIVTERRQVLDRLILEEKEKQRTALMKVQSIEEQIIKEHEFQVQEERKLCVEWMNINKKKFTERKCIQTLVDNSI